MSEIKAIETVYKGYKFRSRLEARWAIVFNELGVDFSYEPDGYDLGKFGKYLPDFYLPDTMERFGPKKGVFVEIKPTAEIDHDKYDAFSDLTREIIVVFTGAPIVSLGVSGSAGDGGYEFIGSNCGDTQMNLVVCQRCRQPRIIFNQDYQRECVCGEWFDQKSIIKAVNKSKQARFEYGDPYEN